MAADSQPMSGPWFPELARDGKQEPCQSNLAILKHVSPSFEDSAFRLTHCGIVIMGQFKDETQ